MGRATSAKDWGWFPASPGFYKARAGFADISSAVPVLPLKRGSLARANVAFVVFVVIGSMLVTLGAAWLAFILRDSREQAANSMPLDLPNRAALSIARMCGGSAGRSKPRTSRSGSPDVVDDKLKRSVDLRNADPRPTAVSLIDSGHVSIEELARRYQALGGRADVLELDAFIHDVPLLAGLDVEILRLALTQLLQTMPRDGKVSWRQWIRIPLAPLGTWRPATVP